MNLNWTKKFFRLPPLAKPGEVNYPAFDRFTFVHFGIGLGYGFFGLSATIVVVLAVLWEIIENPLKANCPFFFPHATADTLQNILGDIFAVVTGWGLYRLL